MRYKDTAFKLISKEILRRHVEIIKYETSRGYVEIIKYTQQINPFISMKVMRTVFIESIKFNEKFLYLIRR